MSFESWFWSRDSSNQDDINNPTRITKQLIDISKNIGDSDVRNAWLGDDQRAGPWKAMMTLIKWLNGTSKNSNGEEVTNFSLFYEEFGEDSEKAIVMLVDSILYWTSNPSSRVGLAELKVANQQNTGYINFLSDSVQWATPRISKMPSSETEYCIFIDCLIPPDQSNSTNVSNITEVTFRVSERAFKNNPDKLEYTSSNFVSTEIKINKPYELARTMDSYLNAPWYTKKEKYDIIEDIDVLYLQPAAGRPSNLGQFARQYRQVTLNTMTRIVNPVGAGIANLQPVALDFSRVASNKKKYKLQEISDRDGKLIGFGVLTTMENVSYQQLTGMNQSQSGWITYTGTMNSEGYATTQANNVITVGNPVYETVENSCIFLVSDESEDGDILIYDQTVTFTQSKTGKKERFALFISNEFEDVYKSMLGEKASKSQSLADQLRLSNLNAIGQNKNRLIRGILCATVSNLIHNSTFATSPANSEHSTNFNFNKDPGFFSLPPLNAVPGSVSTTHRASLADFIRYYMDGNSYKTSFTMSNNLLTIEEKDSVSIPCVDYNNAHPTATVGPDVYPKGFSITIGIYEASSDRNHKVGSLIATSIDDQYTCYTYPAQQIASSSHPDIAPQNTASVSRMYPTAAAHPHAAAVSSSSSSSSGAFIQRAAPSSGSQYTPSPSSVKIQQIVSRAPLSS